jgi:hypothetical protein
MSVLLTKQRLCNKKYKPNKEYEWNTGKGVKLEDELEKVIKAYGKPTIIINLGKETKYSTINEELHLTNGLIYRYLGKSLNMNYYAEFYFRDKKINTILVSISE